MSAKTTAAQLLALFDKGKLTHQALSQATRDARLELAEMIHARRRNTVSGAHTPLQVSLASLAGRS